MRKRHPLESFAYICNPIKTKTILATMRKLILVTAVALLSINAIAGNDKKQKQMEQNVIENIMTRSSVRFYADKNVEDDKVMTLVKAGMAAPSAVNKQPWHFIVVKDKNTLKTISEVTPNARMAADAPLAIIVCGDMDKVASGHARDMWIQDVSAATENILLAAHALGLGAVWTGTYPNPERQAAIAKLMKTPENIIPFCTIVIGYPDQDNKVTPKDKFKESNISYEVFGGKKQ